MLFLKYTTNPSQLFVLFLVMTSLSSSFGIHHYQHVQAFITSTPTKRCHSALVNDDKPTTATIASSSGHINIPTARTTTALEAEKNTNKNNNNNNNNKVKGVYVRPSGAIERGSGFFVPGLEGSRVRVVFGCLLIALTAINHLLVVPNETLSLTESITYVYSIMVLFQALIEFGKEALLVEGTTTAKSSSSSSSGEKAMVQKWNANLLASENMDSEFQSRVQWAAASYLSVTPANQLLLLQKDTIAYRLGGSNIGNDDDDTKIQKGVAAALDQLRQSKGGRIALPLTHPAVEALLNPPSSSSVRTVVLQRITDQSCWMMTSDQLLASFTNSDLKWLGQMAAYITKQ